MGEVCGRDPCSASDGGGADLRHVCCVNVVVERVLVVVARLHRREEGADGAAIQAEGLHEAVPVKERERDGQQRATWMTMAACAGLEEGG